MPVAVEAARLRQGLQPQAAPHQCRPQATHMQHDTGSQQGNAMPTVSVINLERGMRPAAACSARKHDAHHSLYAQHGRIDGTHTSWVCSWPLPSQRTPLPSPRIASTSHLCMHGKMRQRNRTACTPPSAIHPSTPPQVQGIRYPAVSLLTVASRQHAAGGTALAWPCRAHAHAPGTASLPLSRAIAHAASRGRSRIQPTRGGCRIQHSTAQHIHNTNHNQQRRASAT